MQTSTATNLFTAKVKETATAKKAEKKIIKALLEDKIKRFCELKLAIDANTAECKMIEGDIKKTGKEIFMKEYLIQKSTPDNFKIQDETGATCMFIVMDKYTVVDETKAEFLQAIGEGLVASKTTYTFNAELVEKYGGILSDLICNCPDITEEDKPNLIAGEMVYTVAKGSIDRLLQYPQPEQVFELINPILMLKR